jgi:hypothetical protein
MLPQANQFWKTTGIPLISLTLLQLLAISESVAATPKITASASFAKKTQKVVIKGKATGIAPGTYVSFYDASSNKLLYSVKPDAKGAYTANLTDFDSSASSPCNIIAQVGDKKVTIKVAGAAKTCAKTAVLCTATAESSTSRKAVASP